MMRLFGAAAARPQAAGFRVLPLFFTLTGSITLKAEPLILLLHTKPQRKTPPTSVDM